MWGGGGSRDEAADQLATTATEFVASLAPPEPAAQQQQPSLAPGNVGRLAVLSLGAGDWGFGAGSAACSSAVVRCLLRLKAAVRDTRCCALVTVPAAQHSASDLARMQHISDAVVALERVRDDSDIVRWDSTLIKKKSRLAAMF
jgi:hypothetical protein